jgi:predicted nucleotidyltransferase
MKNKDNYNLLILDALRFFLENPYTEVYLREFARKTKINTNTAQRFLDLFLKQKLVVEEKKAHLRYFKANMENIFFKHLKITYSIKRITESGLIDFFKKNNYSNVILFGSVAKGEDDKTSDIDFILIGKNKKLSLTENEKKLGMEINAHSFTYAEWKKQAKDNKAFYQEVISTGINLIGEKPLV